MMEDVLQCSIWESDDCDFIPAVFPAPEYVDVGLSEWAVEDAVDDRVDRGVGTQDQGCHQVDLI